MGVDTRKWPAPAQSPTCTGHGADLQSFGGDHVPEPEGVPLLVDGEPVGPDLQQSRSRVPETVSLAWPWPWPRPVPSSRPRTVQPQTGSKMPLSAPQHPYVCQ